VTALSNGGIPHHSRPLHPGRCFSIPAPRLNQFRIVELDSPVAQLTITLRQQHRLKLPDAIVWASARHAGALLVTRNTKDFPKGEPSVRFPYGV
jgi:predicted nucleic acid-binding protein